MTRPWSPAEIAGAKALHDKYGWGAFELWDDEPTDNRNYCCEWARAVLDATGAALRAEIAAELESLAAQVRGAGAGEQQ